MTRQGKKICIILKSWFCSCLWYLAATLKLWCKIIIRTKQSLCVWYICIFVAIIHCRPPKSVCRQCAEYTGPHPAHGDGNKATTLGAAAAAVGNAVSKVVGLVTGTKTYSIFGLEKIALSLIKETLLCNCYPHVTHWIYTWMVQKNFI